MRWALWCWSKTHSNRMSWLDKARKTGLMEPKAAKHKSHKPEAALRLDTARTPCFTVHSLSLPPLSPSTAACSTSKKSKRAVSFLCLCRLFTESAGHLTPGRSFPISLRFSTAIHPQPPADFLLTLPQGCHVHLPLSTNITISLQPSMDVKSVLESTFSPGTLALFGL